MIKRWTAAVLAAALIWTAPGLAPYVAAGETVAGPVGASAPQAVPLSVTALSVPGEAALSLPSLPSVPAGAAQLGVDLPQPAAVAGAAAASASPEAAQTAAQPVAAGVETPAASAAVPSAQVATAQVALGEVSPAAARPSVLRSVRAVVSDIASAGGQRLQAVVSKLYGERAAAAPADDSGAVTPGTLSSGANGLTQSTRGGAVRPPSPPAPGAPRGPSGSSRRLPGVARLILSLGTMAAAAAAVVGLHAAAIALAPTIFGLAPVAAVWAVSSGALLLPAALYSRYLLSKHDSPRLRGVKVALDVFIGAFLGGLVVAYPSLAVTLTAKGLIAAAPIGAAAGIGTTLTMATGSGGLNWLFAGVSLLAVPAVLGAGAGVIGVAPMIAMLALPAMTTISFFLGSLVQSAESGRPFAVPGSLQKMRFPSFNWVMIGVVFALLTGYGAVHANVAFMLWTLFGNATGSKWDKSQPAWKNLLAKAMNFNVLYAGVLLIAAATAFHSPLTFLVIAFAPERAAHWTERLLGKLLPRGAPAPSTKAAPVDSETLDQRLERKMPRFHFWLKTTLLIGLMAATGYGMGAMVFGFASLLKNLGVAVVLSAIPFLLSDKLIKLTMKIQPTTQKQDPELYKIMSDYRAEINAKLAKKGKKPIPLPFLGIAPTPLPNAAATGRDPYHAMVFVTQGIKDMLLDPENVRSQLVALMAVSDPAGKPFKVFRKAIAGSVPGVSPNATPQEVSQALLRASQPQLKALGVRMLRGVLGHEFSHVMDRHMLVGSIAGSVSTAVAFASYGVMWSVGHAQAAVKRLKDAVLGRKDQSAPQDSATGLSSGEKAGRGESQVEMLEPLSTGIAIKSLPALLRMFAALWVPIILQIVQMASSRNDESQADHDGALLSQDPESLALALGMLMTWQPKAGFRVPFSRLPMLAAWSHLFTVNPLQELQRAGAMPKPDAMSQAVLGKHDNWMFDLFVTHPDTVQRIETLYDISEGMRQGPPPAPPSPPQAAGRRSGRAPPLALNSYDRERTAPAIGRGVLLAGAEGPPPDAGPRVPPNAQPQAPPKAPAVGPLRRALAKISSLWRVLPEEDRNREFWKFTLGQALLTVGANFHYTAFPKLVAPAKADEAKLGYFRAVNWGSQAASSATTGPLIDRTSVKSTLVWTHVARAVLMLSIPLLFFHGYLTFAAFLLIFSLHGFMQSVSITAGSVAFNRILGPDSANYNRANAYLNVVLNVVGVVAPLVAGAFIGAMDLRYGLLSGNALSYVVYGLGALAMGLIAAFFLKIPRDDTVAAARALAKSLKGNPEVRGVSVGRDEEGGAQLLVEVDGDPAEAQGLPASFEGLPVKAVPRRRIARELLDGFRLLRSMRLLKAYILCSIPPLMAADAMLFLAVPRYLADILKNPAVSTGGLHSLPVIGAGLAGLMSQGGAFGLYLAADSLGIGLASLVMAARRDQSQAQLSVLTAQFRAALAARGLRGVALGQAVEAVTGAPEEVLAGYAKDWAADPGRARSAGDFAADVTARACALLAAEELPGLSTPQEAAALLAETGVSGALSQWAARNWPALEKSARRTAKTGLDALERQGRWSAILMGFGWLAMAGVFVAHGLWLSVGLMSFSLLLQGPASVIWQGSLTQRAINDGASDGMGKAYSALNFVELVFSIAGSLLFGWLFTALSTSTALLVTVIVAALSAALSVAMPFLAFPRRGKTLKS